MVKKVFLSVRHKTQLFNVLDNVMFFMSIYVVALSVA
jgi:hypothetical protein